MDIKSKFLYAKTKVAFENEIANIPEGLNPIVFIEDTKELWTCGTYFSIGSPNIIVSEVGGMINVSLGDSNFILTSSGDALNIHKGEGNNIIFNSTALTKVDTQKPLEWDTINKKLLHSESGVISDIYGQTTAIENASIFTIPYFTVDKYGHLISAGEKNVEIRDYVEQLSPSESLTDRNVLLTYNEANNDSDNAQTRKANGLLYNDASGKLTVKGGITSNGEVNINNGDLVVIGGQIIGDVKGNVTGTATPKIHLSEDPEYGGASTNLYGHVKVLDAFSGIPAPSSNESDPTSSTISRGIAASPLLVWNTKVDLEQQIAGIASIGGIDAGESSIEITTNKQRINISGTDGISTNIVDGNIVLRGRRITGYDLNENESFSNSDLKFNQDFDLSDNTFSIRWKDLQ